MRVIEKGHIYELSYIDDIDREMIERASGGAREVLIAERTLTFVNREGNPHPGTQTQEVLRVLIDRTMHCDNCLPNSINKVIIYHLRMALVLHEARALVRKVEKGLTEPENVFCGKDGHFFLTNGTHSEDNKDWWLRQLGKGDDLFSKDGSQKLHGVQSTDPSAAYTTESNPARSDK